MSLSNDEGRGAFDIMVVHMWWGSLEPLDAVDGDVCRVDCWGVRCRINDWAPEDLWRVVFGCPVVEQYQRCYQVSLNAEDVEIITASRRRISYCWDRTGREQIGVTFFRSHMASGRQA